MTENDILTKQTVLLCNRNWQALYTKTPSEAFGMMATNVVTAIDVGEDGSMTPVTWEQWIELPIRPQDNVIHTSKRVIRIPTIIISCSHDKIHLTTPSFSSPGVKQRDQYTCQYCGNKFESDGLNLDHVIPDSRGGKKVWTNIVASCYSCNDQKANRTPQEAKMRLLRDPRAPKGIPPAKKIKNTYKIRDWEHFLIN
jgi:5-methylcytosine-specific restriction endonuclease McrA